MNNDVIVRSNAPSKEVYSFNKGDFIYQKGEISNLLFYIIKGEIKIENPDRNGRCLTMEFLTKGSLFGECILQNERYRINNACALSDVQLYAYTKEEIENSFSNNDEFHYLILNKLFKKVKKYEQRLSSLAYGNSRERVIEFFINLAKREGERVGYEIMIKVFFTHQEVADYTATSRQTVNKLLIELKEKNLLTYNRKRILIRDMELLMEEL